MHNYQARTTENRHPHSTHISHTHTYHYSNGCWWQSPLNQVWLLFHYISRLQWLRLDWGLGLAWGMDLGQAWGLGLRVGLTLGVEFQLG